MVDQQFSYCFSQKFLMQRCQTLVLIFCILFCASLDKYLAIFQPLQSGIKYFQRKEIRNISFFLPTGKKIIKKAYDTRYSQAVTHPSTNRARRCLTSVIGRELVYSTWYGRKHLYIRYLLLFIVILFRLFCK